MNATRHHTITAIGVSGSPAARSKSRTLLEHALAALAERGATPSLIDLAAHPADALLGRRRSDDVDDALTRVSRATIVIASTPVYRATYSGLLKVFFDLLPINGLADKVAIAIATGGSPAHQLVIDHGLRPLFGSVGAITTPTGIYGTDSGFENGVPHPSLIKRVEQAATEAITLSERLHDHAAHAAYAATAPSAARRPSSTLVES
jgi:FMN reductase